MGAFGVGQKKHDVGPLSKEDIAQLPIVHYIPQDDDAPEPSAPVVGGEESAPKVDSEVAVVPEQSPPAEPANTQPLTPSPTSASNRDRTSTRRKQSRRFARLFWSNSRRRRDTNGHSKGTEAGGPNDGRYVATVYPLHALPANLSTCPICLCGTCHAAAH